MRRIICLLLCLLTLCPTLAEEPTLTLRGCSSVEEAQSFVLLPPTGETAGVQPGYIRYIAQNRNNVSFRREYWQGGKPGSVLDLTLKERDGIPFAFHATTMCTRASYSMALSCLGIDLTPGAMSALMNARDLDEPYDDVSALVGVERIPKGRNEAETFNTMVEHYLTDERYSPPCLYVRKPDGSYHALLIIAFIQEKGRYVVVDSNPYFERGKPVPVYFVSLNKMRTEIINSTFKKHFAGSKVLHIWQWRLVEAEAVPEEELPAPEEELSAPNENRP